MLCPSSFDLTDNIVGKVSCMVNVIWYSDTIQGLTTIDNISRYSILFYILIYNVPVKLVYRFDNVFDDLSQKWAVSTNRH